MCACLFCKQLKRFSIQLHPDPGFQYPLHIYIHAISIQVQLDFSLCRVFGSRLFGRIVSYHQNKHIHFVLSFYYITCIVWQVFVFSLVCFISVTTAMEILDQDHGAQPKSSTHFCPRGRSKMLESLSKSTAENFENPFVVRPSVPKLPFWEEGVSQHQNGNAHFRNGVTKYDIILLTLNYQTIHNLRLSNVPYATHPGSQFFHRAKQQTCPRSLAS